MTTVFDVLSQMAEVGVPDPPERLEITGRIRRFGRKKRGWYRLYEHIGRSGRSYVTGSFGYWGIVEATKVRPAEQLDPAELESLRRQAREAAEREERRRRDLAQRAAMRSAERWRQASRSGVSRYLERKGVDGESIRFEPDGTILVPMVRYDLPRDQALVGIQAIAPDGGKRFAKGTAKEGSACRLGCVVVGEPILIAEGYATAASIRMAIERRLPVVVAFDSGNLLPVARIQRELYPQCPIVFCADDDWRTVIMGEPVNVGRKAAAKAARVVGNASITYPVWPGQRADGDTDFNDLHRAAGLGVVSRQLRTMLHMLARRPRISRAAA